ncbi:MAG: hypothetical protein MUF07_17315 [Steroidobacteraceae bacterium]|jgi:hypothetical protein|nr:hypothetical protein [Steroidobacteraceae bacterium]
MARLRHAARRLGLLALLSAAAVAPAARAHERGFDAAALEAWALAHGGRDAPRTYAYEGTVYDLPSGRILATLDGWQLARAFPGGVADPGAWYVVRRAFLLYRAPGSGEILAHYPDVRASRMPVPSLSIVRYVLRGDRLVPTAVAGVRGAIRDVSLPEQLGAAREDGAWVFRRVLTPPDPRQKPFELTEIVAQPGPSGAAPRIRFAMTKVADNWGFLPAGGRHLLHLSWRPVAGLEALAPVVRRLLEEDAPPALGTLPATLDAAYGELGLPRPAGGR